MFDLTPLAAAAAALVTAWSWIGLGSLLTYFLLDEENGPWVDDIAGLIFVWLLWPVFLVRAAARKFTSGRASRRGGDLL